MSDYYTPDIEAHVFMGEGDGPQLAADAAAASLNAWPPFKKWRTMDGDSVYTVTTTIERVGDGWYLCALTAVGPVPKEQEESSAYTGQTERLA